MNLYKWNSAKYTLGIRSIDKQHSDIITTINTLFTTLEITSDKKLIKPLLSHLVFVSRQHFHDEERLMLDYRYPDVDAHIGRHMIFNEALATMIVHYQQNDIPLTLENLKFLSHWTIEHITTADAHYRDFIQKQTA